MNIEQPCVPRRIVVSVMVALAALTAMTILGRTQVHQATGLVVFDVVAGALGCALFPVLLRRPVACGLALAALAALSPAATPAATTAAVIAGERRRLPVAIGVAGAGIAAHAVQGLWRPVSGLPFFWWMMLMVVGYAALLSWGAWTQARHALLDSLHERARRAEAEQGRRVAEARVLERTLIAREMHDVLAHRLSLVATYAGALEYRPDSSPEQLSRAAGVVRAGVHQALGELREVISVLRDDETPDDSRPQPVLADIPRLIEESHDAGERVDLDDRTSRAAVVPSVAGRAAYRVVQEGLTNARKHASGSPVRVRLDGSPGATLVVDIRNPVSGGEPTVPGSGTGLVGLTERVQLAGGRLDHEVTAGGEFHLHASLPWPE